MQPSLECALQPLQLFLLHPHSSAVLKLMAVAEKISGVAVLRSIAVFSWDSKPFKYFL